MMQCNIIITYDDHAPFEWSTDTGRMNSKQRREAIDDLRHVYGLAIKRHTRLLLGGEETESEDKNGRQ